MIAAVLLSFAAVFFIVLALFLAVSTARQSPEAQLKRRLRRMKDSDERYSEASTGDLLKEVSSTEQLIFQLPLLGDVKKLVEHSGVKISPIHVLSLVGAASVCSAVALYALKRNGLIAFIAAAAIFFISYVYLGYRKKQRQDKFAEQLPDTLTMIARSLRAGHSLTAAVELVSQELPEPTGELFKIAYEQQKLGMRMADSLVTLQDRIESVDLHFFITIIRINSETGGNLAEILEKLAETIRVRLQIRRQVQVFTAEGRVSGYVLALLPVFLFIAFQLMRPEYMEVFFKEKSCQMILGAAVFAQVIGFCWMRKISDIRI